MIYNLNFLLLVVVIVLYFLVFREFRRLLKEDEITTIWAFYVFSLLLKPSEHFKKEEIVEGYILVLLLIATGISIAYLLIQIL